MSSPVELIAQHPHEPRDRSRLMLIDRKSGKIEEIVFNELADIIQANDELIFNDTKVIPARLLGKRSQGGQAELLLLKQLNFDHWEVLAKPGKKIREGSWIEFSESENFRCQIIETLPEGSKIVQFHWQGAFEVALEKYGHLPLPPYIHRSNFDNEGKHYKNYQTLFAKNPGAIASPTAALHFTKKLLKRIHEKGVKRTTITLHVFRDI